MLDALALADLLRSADLRDGGQLARILAAYSRARKPEAEALQKASWKIGDISSWSSPPMALAREVAMRTVAGRAQLAGIERQFVAAAAMRSAVRAT